MSAIGRFVKFLVAIAVIAGLALVVFWATRPLQAPQWMGFAPYDPALKSWRAKTLWDWLALLFIPGAIAGGVAAMNYAIKNRDRQFENERQSEAALDSYFGCMTELIVDKRLRENCDNKEICCIARTRTLDMLRRLDGGRKAQVLQFLYEAGLIYKDPVINLIGADLNRANLANATLIGAEIRGAYFSRANLRGSTLREAVLIGCDFSEADMTDCDLENADLTVATMCKTKLNRAILTETKMKWTTK